MIGRFVSQDDYDPRFLLARFVLVGKHPSLDVEGDGSEVVSGFSTARGNLQTIDAKVHDTHATASHDVSSIVSSDDPGYCSRLSATYSHRFNRAD